MTVNIGDLWTQRWRDRPVHTSGGESHGEIGKQNSRETEREREPVQETELGNA